MYELATRRLLGKSFAEEILEKGIGAPQGRREEGKKGEEKEVGGLESSYASVTKIMRIARRTFQYLLSATFSLFIILE